jgi:uncharacterized protein DUF3987/DNA primase RepB-like protein
MESPVKTFLKMAFGPEATGYMCIALLATVNGAEKRQMTEHFFHYPDELDQAARTAEDGRFLSDVYYCPQLFETRRRRKDNVKCCPTVWADLDECPPSVLQIQPNILIESSPGRHQALWSLSHAVSPAVAEDISKRLAYFHADDGCDRSGWDLTQLLRVPGTPNYKYSSNPVVQLRNLRPGLFTPEDFGGYPEVKHSVFLKTPMPTVDELPTDEPEDILQNYKHALLPATYDLFSITPDGEWSEKLWKLEMLLFEMGMTREEVFVVAWDAKCNKYRRDGKDPSYLWTEVCRAFIHYQERVNAVVFTGAEIADLMTPEEEKYASQLTGFVEEYIEWASSLGDAATQYHQAGAFTILSALLSGRVTLPTSYGPVVPNLWFMILGDTTLTRKTTAMDIATDLLQEVDPDVILATDGSVEGLMTGLSTRPRRPSIFLRDEFSGLLEMITKKDYYAGMAETLTKLYDGKMQKKILRKEEVTVRHPILLIFAGGIRNRVQGLLTHEHVSSGFIPRFIFVTAESDTSRLQPLGPPTEKVLGNKHILLDKMNALVDHYGKTQAVRIKETGQSSQLDMRTDAELTPEAWLRYNALEASLVQSGLDSEKPELMTPLFDRLSKNGLKAAILIAAARQVGQQGVTVEVDDVLHAIRYVKQWRAYAIEVVNGIGKTTYERDLERILGAIIKRPGISRSQLMQSYHLTAQQANQVFDTLLQRGQISMSRTETGKQIYHPLIGGPK